LQPDVAAKLPDILKQGLTRLYGHQHADGSWGWFEKDSRNFSMSVYVVYGLARCQAAGTKVDAEVLRRGSAYLAEELRTNRHALAAHARYLVGHRSAGQHARLCPRQGTCPAFACHARGQDDPRHSRAGRAEEAGPPRPFVGRSVAEPGGARTAHPG